MATPTTEWKFKGDFDELTDGAKGATYSLEELRDQLQRERRALSEMNRAMKELKAGGGEELKGVMGELQTRMERQDKVVRGTLTAYVEMGGTFKRAKSSGSGLQKGMAELQQQTHGLGSSLKSTKPAATGLGNALSELRYQAGAAPGAFGQMSQLLGRITKGLDGAKLRAIALTAAFLGLAGAAAVAAKSLISAALASQDARRNELLHFEALTKMRNLWGFAAGKASDLQAAVDKVSPSVSIARGKVAQFADQLYRGGLRGKNLEAALEGASIRASALGEASGGAFAGFATSVALAGGSVKRMSEDIKNRFGGVVEAKMKSLEVQTLKQKENFDSLFDGVDIEPMLTALQRLRDIFNVNTAAGVALKGILGTVLEPLMGAATGGLVMLRRFFKQILIGVQEIQIAFLIVRLWFVRTFGPSTTEGPLSRLFGSFQAGRVFVYLLAAAFGALAVSTIAATWPVLAIAAGVYVLIDIFYDLADAATDFGQSFVAGIQLIQEWWDSVDFAELGVSIIDGLIGGLTSQFTKLKQKVVGLADEVTSWFKEKLGIASPSKVFAELGVAIPQGVGQGVDRGAPQAQRAVDQMIAPRLGKPVSEPTGGPGAATNTTTTTQNSKSVSLTIQELNVHAKSDDPADLADAFQRQLEHVLSSLSLQLGGA